MEYVSLACISAVIGVTATILSVYKDAKKNTERDTAHNTSIQDDIKYISRGVEEIKYDTKTLTASIHTMNERLIRAEESIKSAHEKIDKHINKGDK